MFGSSCGRGLPHFVSLICFTSQKGSKGPKRDTASSWGKTLQVGLELWWTRTSSVPWPAFATSKTTDFASRYYVVDWLGNWTIPRFLA